MKFFLQSHPEQFNLTWNDASEHDWKIIRQFFISAFVNAYLYLYKGNKQLSDPLELNQGSKDEAQRYLSSALTAAKEQGPAVLDKALFILLQRYYPFEKFKDEKEILTASITHKSVNDQYNYTMYYLKHLLALIYYFEDGYKGEKAAIDNQKAGAGNPIQYVIARLHDRPIGFMSCLLNISGRVYLRWVNISPRFHGQGLGRRMFEEIAKRFPEATGLELYTRKSNKGAEQFYPSCGLKKHIENISGSLSELKPGLRIRTSLFTKDVIFPPDDDLISSHRETYKGYQGRLLNRNEKGEKDNKSVTRRMSF